MFMFQFNLIVKQIWYLKANTLYFIEAFILNLTVLFGEEEEEVSFLRR